MQTADDIFYCVHNRESDRSLVASAQKESNFQDSF